METWIINRRTCAAKVIFLAPKSYSPNLIDWILNSPRRLRTEIFSMLLLEHSFYCWPVTSICDIKEFVEKLRSCVSICIIETRFEMLMSCRLDVRSFFPILWDDTWNMVLFLVCPKTSVKVYKQSLMLWTSMIYNHIFALSICSLSDRLTEWVTKHYASGTYCTTLQPLQCSFYVAIQSPLEYIRVVPR